MDNRVSLPVPTLDVSNDLNILKVLTEKCCQDLIINRMHYNIVFLNITKQIFAFKEAFSPETISLEIYKPLIEFITENGYEIDISKTLVDTFWLMYIKFDLHSDNEDFLLELMKELLELQYLKQIDCMERLDPELLLKLDFISSVELFQRKQIRVNTSLLYKQQRYNLLREDSEGYSHLIAMMEYYINYNNGSIQFNDKLTNLIGYFDLDPCRILNIILDILASSISFKHNDQQFIKSIIYNTLNLFPSSFISQVIGFRIQRSQKGTFMQHFCTLIALLFRERIINSLGDIISHISPGSFVLEYIIHGLLLSGLLQDAIGLLSDSHDGMYPLHYYMNAALDNRSEWFISPYIMHQSPIYFTKSDIKEWNSSWNTGLDSALELLSFCSNPCLQLSKDIPLLLMILRAIKREKDITFLFQFLKQYILPAISLIKNPNPALIYELWNVIESSFPDTKIRYQLYKDQYDDHTSIIDNSKKFLRRLSKENVKQIGRSISKYCLYSCPIPVFSIILDQIQAYENLVQPIVECLRYVTPMGMDMLGYVIHSTFINPKESKTIFKADGTSINQWLQNLTNFTGTVYKRYYQIMDLSSIMDVIIQLITCINKKDSYSMEWILLMSDLLSKMGGIESVQDLSSQQWIAQGAGPYLKTESMHSNIMKSSKKPSQKLFHVLVSKGFWITFWIALGQQISESIFPKQYDIQPESISFHHIKFLSFLSDTARDTFIQYTQFVNIHLYEHRHDPYQQIDDSLKSITLTVDILTSKFGLSDSVSWAIFRTLYPFSIDQLETCSFYDTFWQLDSYDISYDSLSLLYTTEINKLLQNIGQDQMNRKKEFEKVGILAEKLEIERNEKQSHIEQIDQSIQLWKDNWLIHIVNRQQVVDFVLYHCVFPRCIFSPSDSIFTINWIHKLHSINTSHFPTLSIYDKLMDMIPIVIISCTLSEASNFGQLMLELFTILTKWYIEPHIYKNEAIGIGKLGFSKQWDKVKDDTSQQLSHDDFKKVFFKWHVKIFKSVMSSLKTDEYSRNRNALMILTRMIDVFPKFQILSTGLEKLLIRAKLKEEREDLRILSARYHSMLQSKSKNLSEESGDIVAHIEGFVDEILKKYPEPQLLTVDKESPKRKHEESTPDHQTKKPRITTNTQLQREKELYVPHGRSHKSTSATGQHYRTSERDHRRSRR